MNSCLKKPCRRGFAFFDHAVFKFQTDHSGSFRYVSNPRITRIESGSSWNLCDCYILNRMHAQSKFTLYTDTSYTFSNKHSDSTEAIRQPF
jgi:hypothetical protein